MPLDPGAPPPRLGYIAGDCGLRVLISSAAKEAAVGVLIAHGAPLDVVLTADGADRSVTWSVCTSSRRRSRASRLDGPGRGHDQSRPRVHPLHVGFHRAAEGRDAVPSERDGVRRTGRRDVRRRGRTTASRTTRRCTSTSRSSTSTPPRWPARPSCSSRRSLRLPRAGSPTFIAQQGITIWYSVPSILTMLVLRGGPDVQADLPAPAHGALRRRGVPDEVPAIADGPAAASTSFYNLYGPTETNVCTWYEVPPLPDDATEPIPIGNAIDDVEVFAILDDGALAGVDDIGELFVRGDTVMHGYWGDAHRSARGLVPDPRGSALRDTVYRTGDLVRLRADGNYELLGRRDHQIKSRGYRIELGEIETALYSHPDVLECVVVAVPDPLVTNRIVAFVAARDGLVEPDLVKVAAERVPHYMLPERIEFIDELPKTSTGKVDRLALTSSMAARTTGGA